MPRPQVVTLSTEDLSEDECIETELAALDTGSVNVTQATEAFKASVASDHTSSLPSYLDKDKVGLPSVLPESTSPLSRLYYLQEEARQLEEELASKDEKAHTPTPSSLTAYLHRLQSRFDRMQIQAEASEANVSLSSMIAALGQGSSTSAAAPGTSTQDASKIVPDIEARIHALEQRLGTNVLEPGTSLASTVARLESHMALLTQPRHLDAIIARAKMVTSELERAQERREQFSSALDDETLAQVEQLYALQLRIEPLEPLAPALLARLQSLAPLHASASEFASTLDHVEKQQEVWQARYTELQALLHNVQESLQSNMEVTRRNLEALQLRLDTISTTKTSPP